MWAGGSQAGGVSESMLGPDWTWWEMQWIVGFPSQAATNCDSGPFPRNLSMNLASARSPGQDLNKACFEFGLKLW